MNGDDAVRQKPDVKQFCVECAADVFPWWFESPGSLTLTCPDCGTTIFELGTPSNEPFQWNDDGLRADGGSASGRAVYRCRDEDCEERFASKVKAHDHARKHMSAVGNYGMYDFIELIPRRERGEGSGE